jgi:hypothetical protein
LEAGEYKQPNLTALGVSREAVVRVQHALVCVLLLCLLLRFWGRSAPWAFADVGLGGACRGWRATGFSIQCS